jgi:hypothetical protein
MSYKRPAALFILLSCFGIGAKAQWLNFPTPGTPRTRDGKANMTAPAPRVNGKPDLSGVWMHEATTVEEVKRLFGKAMDSEIQLAPPGMEIGTQHKYGFNILLDFKPADNPMRPEAAEAFRRRLAQSNPANVCNSVTGIPLAGLLSEPIKIVQAPRVTMILYEVDNLHRQVFTDGRALPQEFNLPAFFGYSVGHWERDTFVVETAGFNDRTALDLMGHPHGEGLKMTERFHRADFGHLDVEMTFDDPQMYTRPFTIKVPHYLLPDADIFEMYCENEKDRAHLEKK